MDVSPKDESAEKEIIEVFLKESTATLQIDITLFVKILAIYYEAVNKHVKRTVVERLLSSQEWFEHYKDKITGKRVLAESATIAYLHELQTAKS